MISVETCEYSTDNIFKIIRGYLLSFFLTDCNLGVFEKIGTMVHVRTKAISKLAVRGQLDKERHCIY